MFFPFRMVENLGNGDLPFIKERSRTVTADVPCGNFVATGQNVAVCSGKRSFCPWIGGDPSVWIKGR